jgi:hypothetical protein
MSTPWRDLIDIPERAGDEDYVLRLTDAVGDDEHLARTLEQYVVPRDIPDRLVRVEGPLHGGAARRPRRPAGSFASGLRGYRRAVAAGDTATADGVAVWLAGERLRWPSLPLPPALAEATVAERLVDEASASAVLREPRTIVHG